MSDWGNLKVVELKAELKRRGLSTAGLKIELITRLEDADKEAAPSDSQPEDAAQEPEPSDAEQPQHTDAKDVTSKHDSNDTGGASLVGQKQDHSSTEPATVASHEANTAPADNGVKLPTPSLSDGKPHETPKLNDQGRDGSFRDRRASNAASSNDNLGRPKERDRQSTVATKRNETSSTIQVIIESNSEALKRKRRSASPLLDEEAVKRRRAAELDQDAAHAPARSKQTPQVDVQEDNKLVRTTGPDVQDDKPAGDIEPEAPSRSHLSPPAMNRREHYSPTDDPEPALHEATPAIYINNLMRPLRAADLKSHLVDLATPPEYEPDESVVVNFFVDSIRTHAFVVFDSISLATHVRRGLHGLIWPKESNRKALFVDFVPADKVDAWIQMEESDVPSHKAGSRWEVLYEPDEHTNTMQATLRSTSLTSYSTLAPGQAGRPPAMGNSMEGAPTGPRSHHVGNTVQARLSLHQTPPEPMDFRDDRPVPTGPPPPRPYSGGSGAPLRTIEGEFLRTVAQPPLDFQPMPPGLAQQRIQEMRGFYTSDTERDLGREINRYSFQDDGRFVDRGREIFEGIRPPHRQHAVDRERGLLPDNHPREGGGYLGRGTMRRGGGPYRPRNKRFPPASGPPPNLLAPDDRPPRNGGADYRYDGYGAGPGRYGGHDYSRFGGGNDYSRCGGGGRGGGFPRHSGNGFPRYGGNDYPPRYGGNSYPTQRYGGNDAPSGRYAGNEVPPPRHGGGGGDDFPRYASGDRRPRPRF